MINTIAIVRVSNEQCSTPMAQWEDGVVPRHGDDEPGAFDCVEERSRRKQLTLIFRSDNGLTGVVLTLFAWTGETSSNSQAEISGVFEALTGLFGAACRYAIRRSKGRKWCINA